MLERKEIRRRLLLKLFGSPLTLLPMMAGTIATLSPVFFDIQPGIPLFIGISAITAATVGTALRALLGRDKITQEIIDEANEEVVFARQRQLLALRTRLKHDGDPRTEGLFDDLQHLVEDLKGADIEETLNEAAADDLQQGIDNLYQGCLNTLEKTVELHHTAVGLNTRKAREALMNERERLLSEVERSVERLGGIVTELRTMSIAGPSAAKLDDLSGALKDTLQAAKQTEEEASRWTALGRDERAIRQAQSQRKETN
jgi:hypothetical protein